MPSLRTRNRLVLLAMGALATASLFAPSIYVKAKGKSLSEREKALTGSQVQRGPYMNSGSRDMGVDPDWDLKNGTYKGRKVR